MANCLYLIYLTSMGAALAALTAYGLVNRYPHFKDRLYIIFLGSPRFARKKFANWLNSELTGRIMQYLNLNPLTYNKY